MESLLCAIVMGILKWKQAKPRWEGREGLGGQRIKRCVCHPERLWVLFPCWNGQAFMVDRNGEVLVLPWAQSGGSAAGEMAMTYFILLASDKCHWGPVWVICSFFLAACDQ